MKEILDRLDEMTSRANVDAVFGEPVTYENRVVIPIAEVSYGFGMGGTLPLGAEGEEGDPLAEGEVPGSGMGGGVRVKPLAYLVLDADGTRVQPVMNEQKIAITGILLGFWAVGWLGMVLKALFSPRKSA